MNLRPFLILVPVLLFGHGWAATTSIASDNLAAVGSWSVIADAQNTPVASGTGTIASGYFPNLTDDEVENLVGAGNYQGLIDEFVAIASGQFGPASLAFLPGYYNFSESNLPPVQYPGAGVTKHLYTFYSNDSTLNTNSETELGLFQHDDVLSETDPSPSIDSYNVGNYGDDPDEDRGNEILIGIATIVPNYDLSPIGGPPSFDVPGMTLVSMPEPSLVVLLLIGNAFLAARRRR